MHILTKIKLATASEVTNHSIAIAGTRQSEIEPGSSQRLCLKTENRIKFIWVHVEALRKELFIGRISQNLLVKNLGINIGDLIEFKLENIVNPYCQ